MRRVRIFIGRLSSDESGATAIEYGLIAGLVSVVIVVALGVVGDALNSVFTNIGGVLSDAASEIS